MSRSGEALDCPTCGGSFDRVVNTRGAADYVRRRRECSRCLADLDEALALLREADSFLTWRTDSNGPDRRGWLARRDALLARCDRPKILSLVQTCSAVPAWHGGRLVRGG